MQKLEFSETRKTSRALKTRALKTLGCRDPPAHQAGSLRLPPASFAKSEIDFLGDISRCAPSKINRALPVHRPLQQCSRPSKSIRGAPFPLELSPSAKDRPQHEPDTKSQTRNQKTTNLFRSHRDLSNHGCPPSRLRCKPRCQHRRVCYRWQPPLASAKSSLWLSWLEWSGQLVLSQSGCQPALRQGPEPNPDQS